MNGRIDHHRFVIRIHVGNLLIHLEKVAVTGFDDVLAQAGDRRLEIQEHGQSGLVHAEACIAAFFGGTRSHIARHEVTESRITALQVVVAILLGDIRSFLLFRTDRLNILFLFRHPDPAVVTQRLGHQRQFRLLRTVHRDTGRVDLREAGIRKVGALLVALPCGRTVRIHRVGRQEENVAVTARCNHHGVCTEALDLTGNQVAGDDTARLAVDHHEVQHFVTRITLHVATGNTAVQGCISAEQQLLAGLAAGVKRTGYLRAAERAVIEQSAVVTGERHALCYALVDDRVRDVGQTIHVCLTGTVVAALDRIVEEAEHRVVVVLVVFRSIDTALCGNRMRTAGRVTDAEHLYIISQIAERSGCRCAAKTGTDYDDVEFSFVSRADHLDVSFVLAPFLRQRAGRNLRI